MPDDVPSLCRIVEHVVFPWETTYLMDSGATRMPQLREFRRPSGDMDVSNQLCGAAASTKCETHQSLGNEVTADVTYCGTYSYRSGRVLVVTLPCAFAADRVRLRTRGQPGRRMNVVYSVDGTRVPNHDISDTPQTRWSAAKSLR